MTIGNPMRMSSQYKEVASSFYMLIKLANGSGGGDGISMTASWGRGFSHLEFLLPHLSEIMGGADATDSGVGKERLC